MVRQGMLLSCLLIALGLSLFAQPKQAPPVHDKIPLEATFKILAAQPASRQIVQGAPYSATATTETVQTLGDGNQIIQRNQMQLYRDSEGRTRSEQTLKTIGKWIADGAAPQIILIVDPTTGLSYHLDPRTRTAQRNLIAAPKTTVAMGNANVVVNGKTGMLAEEKALREKKQKAQEERQQKPATSRREALGKQMMEGVEVEGTRLITIIPAGEIGNVRPLEILDETWYSPALQLVMLRKQRDPRSGETIYRLTNLNRSEPARSLFEVPAAYTIKENKTPLKPKPEE